MSEIQISAFISDSAREEVERYAESHGVKKGHLIEEALLHHLQALRELPSDIIIPPRLTLERASFDRIADLVKRPRKATAALRDLMSRASPDDAAPTRKKATRRKATRRRRPDRR